MELIGKFFLLDSFNQLKKNLSCQLKRNNKLSVLVFLDKILKRSQNFKGNLKRKE